MNQPYVYQAKGGQSTDLQKKGTTGEVVEFFGLKSDDEKVGPFRQNPKISRASMEEPITLKSPRMRE